ncbi:zinc-ribbon domain-containing protein [Acholeplasma sp. OttesenSCG-928-E16]|nr:zinc-ribbon domain-containing protein [Acholeplasma sp. OttesenSCG-928-E16]
MKYCRNCGSQVGDGVVYCPYCGAEAGNDERREAERQSRDPYLNPDYKKSETLGWVAIWVGFLLLTPLVAFICGGIGLSKAKSTGNSKGRTLCIVGIILGVVAVFINIFLSQWLLEQLAELLA